MMTIYFGRILYFCALSLFVATVFMFRFSMIVSVLYSVLGVLYLLLGYFLIQLGIMERKEEQAYRDSHYLTWL